jgi:hypothetical protein
MFMSTRWAFYPLNSLDSADVVTDFCRLPDGLVPTVWSKGNDPYSKREAVIHRVTKVLLAAKIALRSLNRCVTQQKLNLLKFTTARVT